VANADATSTGLDDFLLPRISLGNLLLLGAFALIWQTLFLLFGLYDTTEARALRSEAPSVVTACTLGAVVSFGLTGWSESGAFSPAVALMAWPVTAAATLGARFGLRKIAERAETHRAHRVVIVGSGPLALRLHDRVIGDPTSGYELVGFVDTNTDIGAPEVRERLLGTLDNLEQILMHTVVDEVLIALPIKSRYAEIQRVIEECERAGVQSRYSADVFPSRLARAHLEPSGGQPAVTMKVVSDDYRTAIKRTLDIIAATLGLLAIAPLLGAIAVAVKATSRGPVIFGQERYGWRKRRFTMYKFRTMLTNAEAMQDSLEARNEAVGPIFKMKNDPRVTPLGRFLRRTSLDELPQLWNVLRGDMSLVGPRPLPLRDVHHFTDARLMRRFSVPPGLTGLWQVSGRSRLTFDDWVQLDLRYIDEWSLSLDLRILARTLPVVLRADGAS
jgi:exopolysaccharide biosynthesis polyprenyl glycosylphosphotransferase